jgi:hypothetical protein
MLFTVALVQRLLFGELEQTPAPDVFGFDVIDPESSATTEMVSYLASVLTCYRDIHLDS